MDSRVKTGKDLKCDYTGESCEALIKLFGSRVNVGGQPEEFETAWLSSKVLCEALRLVQAVEPTKTLMHELQEMKPPAPLVDDRRQDLSEKIAAARHDLSQMRAESNVGPAPMFGAVEKKNESAGRFSAVPSPRIQGRDIKDPPEVVREFADACEELKENPPKSDKSKHEGVAESDMRALIKAWHPTFRNKNQMFKPLAEHFGLDRDRFSAILDGMSTNRKRG